MSAKSSIKELTVIGLMTAVLCILAPFSFMLPGLVPGSLATLVIYFYPYLLGARRSTVCCLIYIILGAVGLPVFSGFTGGLPRLAGPTGGYIIGYFWIILFENSALKRFPNMRAAHVIGMVMGTIGCYILGTIQLALSAGLSFTAALMAGVIPFIPADAVKIAITVIIAPTICSRLEKAGSLPKQQP